MKNIPQRPEPAENLHAMIQMELRGYSPNREGHLRKVLTWMFGDKGNSLVFSIHAPDAKQRLKALETLGKNPNEEQYLNQVEPSVAPRPMLVSSPAA